MDKPAKEGVEVAIHPETFPKPGVVEPAIMLLVIPPNDGVDVPNPNPKPPDEGAGVGTVDVPNAGVDMPLVQGEGDAAAPVVPLKPRFEAPCPPKFGFDVGPPNVVPKVKDAFGTVPGVDCAPNGVGLPLHALLVDALPGI